MQPVQAVNLTDLAAVDPSSSNDLQLQYLPQVKAEAQASDIWDSKADQPTESSQKWTGFIKDAKALFKMDVSIVVMPPSAGVSCTSPSKA